MLVHDRMLDLGSWVMQQKWMMFAVAAAFLGSGCGDGSGLQADLQARVDELERRVERQEDVEAIEKLAFVYGYFMDNGLTDEVVTLLADDTEYCEITGYGRYDGRDGCANIWTGILGPALQNEDGGLKFGRLIKHYLVKPVVEVEPDGKRAIGRFDYIGYSGIYGRDASTSQQLGVYRLGFLKENDIWKISRFSLSFDASNWNDRSFASDPVLRCPREGVPEPDGPPSVAHPFPEHAIAPFQFVNPVTGKPIRTYVNPQRHWQGNWEGEFGGPCGPLGE